MASADAPAVPATDPRTTDAVTRFALPFPVSAPYHGVRGAATDVDRVHYNLKLLTDTLRFLALIALADALSGGPTPREALRWLKEFRSLGLRRSVELVKDCVAGSRPSHIPELAGLVAAGSPWLDALDRLFAFRNGIVHDTVVVTSDEAPEFLRGLEPDIRVVLQGVQFLRHYQLGYAQSLRTLSDRIVYYWYCARGQVEAEDPVEFESDRPLGDHEPALLDTRSGDLLHLAPLIIRDCPNNHTRRHLLLLHRLETDRSDRFTGSALYRDPMGLFQRCRPFAVQPGPTKRELSIEQFVETPGLWPRVHALGQSVSSAFLCGHQPMGFDERYEVLGLLGRGGMAEVWQVYDRQLKVERAVKILDDRILRAPDAIQRFWREATQAIEVVHPRVVHVLGADVAADRRPYLIMEHLDGETLEQRVSRCGRVPAEQAIEWLGEALEALAAVHAKEIVHRDVKPSNFMVTSQGLSLIDFGIALRAGDSRITLPLDRMGTPDYMAPEQAEGDCSVRSDLYSAAEVLYFVLTGAHPAGRRGDRLERLRAVAPDPLCRVYARATEQAPEARYASASELQQALEAALSLHKMAAEAPATDATPRLTMGTAASILAQFEDDAPTTIARAVWRLGVETDPRRIVIVAYELTKMVLEHFELERLLVEHGVDGPNPPEAQRRGSQVRGHQWVKLQSSGRVCGESFTVLLERAETLRQMRSQALSGIPAPEAELRTSALCAIEDVARFLEHAEPLLRSAFVLVSPAQDLRPDRGTVLRGRSPSAWRSQRQFGSRSVALDQGGLRLDATPLAVSIGVEGDLAVATYAYTDKEDRVWLRTIDGAIRRATDLGGDALDELVRRFLEARDGPLVPRLPSDPPRSRAQTTLESSPPQD